MEKFRYLVNVKNITLHSDLKKKKKKRTLKHNTVASVAFGGSFLIPGWAQVLSENSSFGCFCKRWQKSEAEACSGFDLSVVLSDYTAGSQTILQHRGARTGATHTVHTFTQLSHWMPFSSLRCSVCSEAHKMTQPALCANTYCNTDWKRNHVRYKFSDG